MIYQKSFFSLLMLCGLNLAAMACGPVLQTDEANQQPEKNFGQAAPQVDWLQTPPLPEWTHKKRFTEGGIEQLIAGTAPFMSPAEAEAELDREMSRIAREWIGERFSLEAAEQLQLSPQAIRAQWMCNHETIPCIFKVPGSSPDNSHSMYRSFAQLALTDNVVNQVSQLWETKQVALREERQRGKLIQWSIGGGALLCLLASVHSYLRVDYLTRGYQTVRLRLLLAGTSAAIIGLSLWLLNVVK